MKLFKWRHKEEEEKILDKPTKNFVLKSSAGQYYMEYYDKGGYASYFGPSAKVKWVPDLQLATIIYESSVEDKLNAFPPGTVRAVQFIRQEV